jgi:hypothetical protein
VEAFLRPESWHRFPFFRIKYAGRLNGQEHVGTASQAYQPERTKVRTVGADLARRAEEVLGAGHGQFAPLPEWWARASWSGGRRDQVRGTADRLAFLTDQRMLWIRPLTTVGRVRAVMLLGGGDGAGVTDSEAITVAEDLDVAVVLFAPGGTTDLAGDRFQARSAGDEAGPGTWSMLHRDQDAAGGWVVDSTDLPVLPVQSVESAPAEPRPQARTANEDSGSDDPLLAAGMTPRVLVPDDRPVPVASEAEQLIDSDHEDEENALDLPADLLRQQDNEHLLRLAARPLDEHLPSLRTTSLSVAEASSRVLVELARTRGILLRRGLRGSAGQLADRLREIVDPASIMNLLKDQVRAGHLDPGILPYAHVLLEHSGRDAQASLDLGSLIRSGDGPGVVAALLDHADTGWARPGSAELAHIIDAAGGNQDRPLTQIASESFTDDPGLNLIQFMLGEPVSLIETVSAEFAAVLSDGMQHLTMFYSSPWRDVEPGQAMAYSEWSLHLMRSVTVAGVSARLVTAVRRTDTDPEPDPESIETAARERISPRTGVQTRHGLMVMVEEAGARFERLVDVSIGPEPMSLSQWVRGLGMPDVTQWWQASSQLSHWRVSDAVATFLAASGPGSGLVIVDPGMAVAAHSANSEGRPGVLDLAQSRLVVPEEDPVGPVAAIRAREAALLAALAREEDDQDEDARSDSGSAISVIVPRIAPLGLHDSNRYLADEFLAAALYRPVSGFGADGRPRLGARPAPIPDGEPGAESRAESDAGEGPSA